MMTDAGGHPAASGCRGVGKDGKPQEPRPSVIVFSVPGPPRGKAKSFGFGRGFVDRATQKYMDDIGWAAKAVIAGRPFRLLEKASLTLTGIYPIPPSWPKRKQEAAALGEIPCTARPDLDNVMKAVGDALNGIIWRDDAVITSASLDKTYGREPRLLIAVNTGN